MRDGPDPETLLDLAQDKVVVLDEHGVYRHLNAATTDVIGFEPDELVGTDAFDLVHPDDEERLREAFAAIVAGEAPPDEPLEYRYRTADGGWTWLRTRVHAPASTGVDGYVLTSRDVSCEVESRRRLETIASVSPDVFWMFSADWSELLFVNGAVERVFDVSVEYLERNPESFLEAVHPDDRPYVERAMERLSAGESTLIDYRLGAEDGATRWVRVPGEPVTEGGEVVAVTGFARDVTDEYRRERQLAVMDNLLRHTIRNDMNIVDGTAERIADRAAAAEAVDPEAWEVDGSEAWDVDGSEAWDVDGAEAAPADPAELAELGAELAEDAETIRRVASDLLTSAEKQREVIDLLRHRGSPQSVEVAPVVEEALDMVVDDCDGRGGIDISYRRPSAEGSADPTAPDPTAPDPTAPDPTADGAPVDDPADDEWRDCDPADDEWRDCEPADEAVDGESGAESESRDDGDSAARVSVSYPRNVEAFTHPELDYAIAELVENAIEHAESTPRVRVDVTETDGAVEISIRDNCPPIPAEERYVITDRWEMDDLRHTGGMGLWLVYWVANRSGGDLSFDTHPNGNVVTLSVPTAGRGTFEDELAAPHARPRTAVGRANGGGDAGERGGADPDVGTGTETD